MTAEFSLGADFARDARDLRSERRKLVHHRVDGVLQLQNLAFDVHGDFLAKIAGGNCSGDCGDVADLRREVRRHEIHRVGQIFPGTGNAFDVGLTAQVSFGADLARHARHFRGERAQLVHHGVDGVLELKDFALHVDGDLLRQIAACYRGRYIGNVAHLCGEIGRHRVHRIGQIFPCPADTRHLRLAAEFAFGADFARHARHFCRKRAELIHHRVNRVLQF